MYVYIYIYIYCFVNFCSPTKENRLLLLRRRSRKINTDVFALSGQHGPNREKGVSGQFRYEEGRVRQDIYKWARDSRSS